MANIELVFRPGVSTEVEIDEGLALELVAKKKEPTLDQVPLINALVILRRNAEGE